MKEAKKEDVAGILRKAWLDRTASCQESRSILNRLQVSLSEHQTKLEQETLRCARLLDEAGRMFRGGASACVRTDATVLAIQLIAGKDLEARMRELILEEQKLLDPFYNKIYFGEGNADHLAFFKGYDAERAAVLILTAAIRLQKRTVASVIWNSMQKFSHAIAPARAETARAVLAAIAQIQTLVKADQALVEGLSADELQQLRPGPFPVQLLGNEAHSWILDAISEGMIDPAELGNL